MGQLTAPQRTPDMDNLHCGLTQWNYVLTVLWKQWHVLVPVHWHSCSPLWSFTHIYSTVIAIMEENTALCDGEIYWVQVTSWVIDRNPWCGVYTTARLHIGELKCLVSAWPGSRTDLPYRLHYSCPFFPKSVKIKRDIKIDTDSMWSCTPAYFERNVCSL